MLFHFFISNQIIIMLTSFLLSQYFKWVMQLYCVIFNHCWPLLVVFQRITCAILCVLCYICSFSCKYVNYLWTHSLYCCVDHAVPSPAASVLLCISLNTKHSTAILSRACIIPSLYNIVSVSGKHDNRHKLLWIDKNQENIAQVEHWTDKKTARIKNTSR